PPRRGRGWSGGSAAHACRARSPGERRRTSARAAGRGWLRPRRTRRPSPRRSAARAPRPRRGSGRGGWRRFGGDGARSGAMRPDGPVRHSWARRGARRRRPRRERPRRRQRRAFAPRGTRRGGHSFRAPRARLPWPPHRNPSLPVVLPLHDRPDLDRAVSARWAAFCPGDRLVEIRDRDEEVVGELLLRVGIGTIEHIGLAALLAHGRRGRARLQPLARGHAGTGLVKRRVESGIVGPELLLRRGREGGFVVVDQHHVAHDRPPWVGTRIASRYPNDGPEP